jgi:UDP-glucose 4-epimerase
MNAKSMNKNVLVVGGAGYIGSHVAKELFKKGYYPIIYDNLINGHREFAKWGAFIKADLSNKTTLDIVFQKYSIIAVMHFAAFTYVGESVEDPRKYYINNVAHTIDLLDLMPKNTDS